MRATTARPRPVPRARCGVKGTNALVRCSRGSGRPGSFTVSSQPPSRVSTATSTKPPPTSSAATAACRQRIFTAVRTRTGSMATGGILSGTVQRKTTPRVCHSASTPSTASRTGVDGSPGIKVTDGGRANSSTSLRSNSMLSTSRRAMLVLRRSLVASVPCRSSVCSAIFTAESGLRTSCATREAKRARSSARSAASTTPRLASRSRTTATTPPGALERRIWAGNGWPPRSSVRCSSMGPLAAAWARSRAARSPPVNSVPAGDPSIESALALNTRSTAPRAAAMVGDWPESHASAQVSCAAPRKRPRSSQSWTRAFDATPPL